MARTDNLNHFLTDVADAIRNKTGSQETIQASSFDTAIENIPSGGTDGLYLVKSVEERDELQNVNYGDICIVYNDNDKINIPEGNFITSVIYFPEEVVLDEPLVDGDHASIWVSDYPSGGSDNISIYVEVYNNETHAFINGDINGTYLDIEYSTNDNQTFTRVQSIDSVVSQQDIEFIDEGYSDNYELASKFAQIKSITFAGIYRNEDLSDNPTWEYLNIGIINSAENIFKNKKAYTNEGTIIGNFDISNYRKKNYYFNIQDEEGFIPNYEMALRVDGVLTYGNDKLLCVKKNDLALTNDITSELQNTSILPQSTELNMSRFSTWFNNVTNEMYYFTNNTIYGFNILTKTFRKIYDVGHGIWNNMFADNTNEIIYYMSSDNSTTTLFKYDINNNTLTTIPKPTNTRIGATHMLYDTVNDILYFVDTEVVLPNKTGALYKYENGSWIDYGYTGVLSNLTGMPVSSTGLMFYASNGDYTGYTDIPNLTFYSNQFTKPFDDSSLSVQKPIWNSDNISVLMDHNGSYIVEFDSNTLKAKGNIILDPNESIDYYTRLVFAYKYNNKYYALYQNYTTKNLVFKEIYNANLLLEGCLWGYSTPVLISGENDVTYRTYENEYIGIQEGYTYNGGPVSATLNIYRYENNDWIKKFPNT